MAFCADYKMNLFIRHALRKEMFKKSFYLQDLSTSLDSWSSRDLYDIHNKSCQQ